MQIRGFVIQLDGIIINNASLHREAWLTTLQSYLNKLHGGEKLQDPEDPAEQRQIELNVDFWEFEDEPELKLLEDKCAHQKIQIPMGNHSDNAGEPTLFGLQKEQRCRFKQLAQSKNLEAFRDAEGALNRWQTLGLQLAALSDGPATVDQLRVLQLDSYFQSVIDPETSEKQRLQKKPSPDYFLKSARNMNLKPQELVAIVRSVFGVQGAREAGIANIVGINRTGSEPFHEELINEGAGQVVSTLSELTWDPASCSIQQHFSP
jgi:beta-phosphoglucomutase-like phosphatase (HAD superfamily)